MMKNRMIYIVLILIIMSLVLFMIIDMTPIKIPQTTETIPYHKNATDVFLHYKYQFSQKEFTPMDDSLKPETIYFFTIDDINNTVIVNEYLVDTNRIKIGIHNTKEYYISIHENSTILSNWVANPKNGIEILDTFVISPYEKYHKSDSLVFGWSEDRRLFKLSGTGVIRFSYISSKNETSKEISITVN